jgi:DNA-binding transcriptional LysR family regulator
MKGAGTMHNITYQQIETFLTVVKYLSVSKAAEAMYVSQPSLSMTLQRLESSIGVPLFARNNKGVILTDAGMYLYSALRPMYDNTERAIQFIKDNMASFSKSIHIVTPINYDVSDEFYPIRKTVKKYETAHPSVVVIESLFEFRELRQVLEFGGADLAVAPDFVLSDVMGATYKQVARFEYYIAMSASHPIASCALSGAMTADMLNDNIFYAMPAVDEAADRSLVMKICAAAGFSPNKLEFPPNHQTLLHAIRSGKGLSICLKCNGENDIIFYPLKKLVNIFGGVVIAWRPDKLSPEIKSLLDYFPRRADKTKL